MLILKLNKRFRNIKLMMRAMHNSWQTIFMFSFSVFLNSFKLFNMR